MIEDIKKEINYRTFNLSIGKIIKYDDVLEILDKYNNQQEFKWKCDVCGTGFNNFHAQGFDNKIYCPLCYFKHELTQYKNAWEELKNDNTELIEYGNRVVKDCKIYKNKKMYLLEQKYNLGGE